jgi:ferredoxin
MDEVYTGLAERLNHPKSPFLLQILQKIMTPEEGRLVLELPLPTVELAAKLNANEGQINSSIQDLWRRGLLTAIKDGYAFWDDALWLHDWSLAVEGLDPVVRQLWKDWIETDEMSHHVAKQMAGPRTPYVRLVPTAKSLDAFKKVSNEPVLPYEDPRQIVEGVELIALRDYCSCRRVMMHCEHPHKTCLQFNQYAEHDISRSIARKISVDEAVAVLDMSEESGLVHLLQNTAEFSRIRSICNCCECGCFVIFPGKRHNTLRETIAKTRYEAVVDLEACEGCQLCIDRCNFDAIDMVKPAGSKKYKVYIDPEKCWGCGVCLTVCEPEAISLKLVRPVTHIPVKASQKAYMA